MSQNKSVHQSGFTLVEIVIIAPLVLLLIGAFVAIIVNMTGEVLRSKASTTLAYNVQDALDRIEQDIKQSGAFLAKNDITLQSPQGVDDGTGAFLNANSTTGTMLILDTATTSENPSNSTRKIVYLTNTPNACASTLVNRNSILQSNIVYFVKTDTTTGISSLWRRTIMPAAYATSGCSVPWQQPSCSTVPASSFCKAKDVRVLDGVRPTDFTINYYVGAGSTTIVAAAANTGATDASRQAALVTATTVTVKLKATQTVAGQDITQSGTLRATRLNDF